MKHWKIFLVFVAFFELSSPALAKTPVITWSSNLELTIPRGEFTEVEVWLTSEVRVRNAELVVVPEIAPFVAVNPNAFSVIEPGVPVAVTFTVTAPTSAEVDVYDGAIFLVKGHKTLPNTLKVVLTIGEEIGSAGGVVESADGRTVLSVPPGAVGGDPLVFTVEEVDSVSLPPPEWGEFFGTAYDFGPDGSVFDVPLRLTIQYVPGELPSGVDPSTLRIAWQDEFGDWFGIGGSLVDTIGQTVSASVWHFTRFLLIVVQDNIAPGPPTNVTVTTSGNEATIEWTNPFDPPGPDSSGFNHVTIYRSSEEGLLGIERVTERVAPFYVDTMADGKNCYTIHAVDLAGNESSNTDQYCVSFDDEPVIVVLQDKANRVDTISFASPIGQSFTAPSSEIRTFGFFLDDVNPTFAPNDFSVTISLYEGAGVGGTLLASRDFNELTPGYLDWADVDFSGIPLVPGGIYTAVIENDTVRWAIWGFCGIAAGGDAYAGGAMLFQGTFTFCDFFGDFIGDTRFRIGN